MMLVAVWSFPMEDVTRLLVLHPLATVLTELIVQPFTLESQVNEHLTIAMAIIIAIHQRFYDEKHTDVIHFPYRICRMDLTQYQGCRLVRLMLNNYVNFMPYEYD